MKNIINKSLMFIIAVFFLYILFSSLYLESNVYYKQNSFISLIVSIFILLIWIYMYKIIKRNKDKISNRKAFILLIVYFVIISIIQVITIKTLSVDPEWDFNVIYKNALDYVYKYNRLISVYPEYFDLFRNNIIIFIIDYLPIKVSYVLKLNPLYCCWGFNIMFIDLALAIMYKTIKNKFGVESAFFSLIISLFFVPLFMYTTIFYSDTYSLFIPISLVLVINKLDDKSNNKIYWIILGILLFLGKEIKITTTFIVIGYMFRYFSYKIDAKRIINIGFMIFTLIICCLVFNKFVVEKDSYNFFATGKGAYPYTHWIMMGIEDPDDDNTGRNSYGGYNSKDYELTAQFSSRKNAARFNIQEYIRRVKKYGFIGYFNYLTKKAVNTWTDGYYFADVKISINPRHPNSNIYNFIITDPTKHIMIYFTQGVQYAMLICLILGTIVKYRSKNIDYIRVAIFGLLIFFLFWENRSRYLFNYILIFIYIITEFVGIFLDEISFKIGNKC